MKSSVVILILTASLFVACNVSRNTPAEAGDKNAKVTEAEEADSTEYELVIFDSEFETWFQMNSRPISFYDEEYLQNWNNQLVRQWNTFTTSSGRADCRPISHIDYDPSIDYGKELQYKLFYYFKYMQQRCRIFNSRPGEWR